MIESVKTAPLISIVLPVYNGQEYLQSAIDSCLKQSLGDFELLIADDGSTDSSWSIIEKAASLDQRIRAWKNKDNLGLFRNYNFCMEQACGKYIKPFAQDDLLSAHCLEKLSFLLEQDSSLQIVTSARRIIDQMGDEIGTVCEFPNDTTLRPTARIKWVSPALCFLEGQTERVDSTLPLSYMVISSTGSGW
jgi:glycosyltransferase involved in cell wall biosynthesis